MTDQLDQATDSELNEAFAREVARWIPTGESSRGLECIVDEPEHAHMAVANFTADANAVLPWLEKYVYVDIGRDVDYVDGPWHCAISTDLSTGRLDSGGGKTFARAACIALIRAQRVTSSGTSSTAPTPPPR